MAAVARFRAMAAKLKVFTTRIGFHEAIVAAPSQKAALAAWDVRENLFAQGAASTTDEPQAVEAATAAPGVVLRRAAGSWAPFSQEPDLPSVPKLDRLKSAKPAAKAAPDRRPLEAAEKALAELDREERKTRDGLEQRRRALEAEARALDGDVRTRRLALRRERDRIRRVYQREGGS